MVQSIELMKTILLLFGSVALLTGCGGGGITTADTRGGNERAAIAAPHSPDPTRHIPQRPENRGVGAPRQY